MCDMWRPGVLRENCSLVSMTTSCVCEELRLCEQEKKASLCQHARKMVTSGGLGDMNGNVLSLLTNSCKELLFCLKSRPLVAVQTGEKTWREGKGAFRDRAREQVRGQRTLGHSVTSVRVKRTPSHISQVTMRTSCILK